MPTRDSAWPEGTPCWVDCQVDDTKAAREFYGRLFGWQIEDGPEEFGGYLMAMKDGKAAAGIGPKPEGMPMPSVWTTYIAADSADAVADKITAAGGQVMMPPFDVADVGRMFVGLDSTGGAFGVWQAMSHNGVGICNEPGTLCWNELHTRQYDEAKRFYGEVFGYSYQGMMGGSENGYATFSLPGSEDGVGGICDDTAMPDAPEAPTHWLTWFAVDDVDASTALVAELGGQAMMPPMDMPVGRASVVAGPQGEFFGLIALQTPPDED